MDPYVMLGVPPTATPEEIQSAYQQKRAELLGREADGASLAAELQALEAAYAQLSAPAAPRAAEVGRSLVPADPMAVTAPLAPPPPPVPQRACPHCGALNPAQATICLTCSQQISRPCPYCGQQVLLGVQACGRCGTVLPEYDQKRFVEAVATDQRIQKGRQENDVRVQTLEAGHRVNRVLGAIFWLAIPLVCLGLLALAALVFRASLG